MFLLLLMGLGAASVKAQVRIGGNTAPSAAAVLDLNATDATNAGTGGLVLPRVNLTSNTMQLTTGVDNVTGTMVYNVSATLGGIGVYFWSGTAWAQASLPVPTTNDTGHFLIVRGSTWASSPAMIDQRTVPTTYPLLSSPVAGITWTKVFDAIVQVPVTSGQATYIINVPGLNYFDVCTGYFGDGGGWLVVHPNLIRLFILDTGVGSLGFPLHCYRPSA